MENMDKKGLTRREALSRIGLGILGIGLFSALPIACTYDKRIPKANQSNLRIACNQCQTCIPCPYGIDIRQNIKVYNQACCENRLPDPRQQGSDTYTEDGILFIKELNKQVPRLAQADRCIGCNKCVGQCPQHLPIPQTMRQIENLTLRVQEDLFEELCQNNVF